MEKLSQVNKTLRAKFAPLYAAGCRRFDFVGGRRSGKTYFILQFLLTQMLKEGDIINVASMTAEQGRLGAYADAVDILKGTPSAYLYCAIKRTPKEIECLYNSGRMFFNSYANGERAKGIACDWLFVNEANNFTWQQFIDLAANVRKGVIIDHNPNKRFWVDNYFSKEQQLHSTWQDNEYLTPEQHEYFRMLKANAEKIDATALDLYLYKVYYLGEYAELEGEIFNGSNVSIVERVPDDVGHYTIFCDPSALRGSDYFACVLGASDGTDLYIVDTISVNDGTDRRMVERLYEWCCAYDVEQVFIETNGIIGLNFYEFAINSGLNAASYLSRGNKFERITANYQGLTQHVHFVNPNGAFMQQIYDFGDRCLHDDNIDAVNSLYNIFKFNGLIAL